MVPKVLLVLVIQTDQGVQTDLVVLCLLETQPDQMVLLVLLVLPVLDSLLVLLVLWPLVVLEVRMNPAVQEDLEKEAPHKRSGVEDQVWSSALRKHSPGAEEHHLGCQRSAATLGVHFGFL